MGVCVGGGGYLPPLIFQTRHKLSKAFGSDGLIASKAADKKFVMGKHRGSIPTTISQTHNLNCLISFFLNVLKIVISSIFMENIWIYPFVP